MAHEVQSVGGDFWGSRAIEVKNIIAVTLSSHVHGIVGNSNTVIERPDFVVTQHSHRFIALMVLNEGFYVRAGRFPNRTFVDADVDVALNQITDTDHGFLSGAGPFHLGSSGVVPAGLDETTDYYIHAVDDDTIMFHLNHNDAHKGKNGVDITAAAGTGTHTYATMKAGEPTVTNERGDESIHLSSGAGKGGEVSVIFAMPQYLTVVGSHAASRLIYWSLP